MKRIVKALVEMTLGYMTNDTPYEHFVDIPIHLGLIKVFLEYLKGLVDVKVTD